MVMRKCMEFLLMPLFQSTLITLAGALLLVFLVRRVGFLVAHKIKKTDWLRRSILACIQPATWLVMGSASIAIIKQFGLQQKVTWGSLIDKCQDLLVIAVVVYLAVQIKHIAADFFIKKHRSKKVVVVAADKVGTIFIIVNALFMLMHTLGLPLQALLAFGGVGGIAVGWAAKDIIANLFGGLMIFITQPFTVDDWIKSPTKGFEGVVEEIGWYMTRMRSLDRQPFYVPNSLIAGSIIENPGHMYNRRIKQTVGIRYDDISQLQKIVNNIKEMLCKHEGIAHDLLITCHFIKFGDSSLDIYFSAFTLSTGLNDFRTVQQDVLINVAAIIEQAGAQVAFPTSVLHVKKEAEKN